MSPPKLLGQVRTVARVKHFSRKTEDAYASWIKRFILFSIKNVIRLTWQKMKYVSSSLTLKVSSSTQTTKEAAHRRVSLLASCICELRGGASLFWLLALRQGLSSLQLLQIAFCFFDSRMYDVALKLSQENIELPARGVLLISFLSVPPFVPNGSSGTLKTTELLGLPLATDGPRDERDNPNSLCYLVAKSSER